MVIQYENLFTYPISYISDKTYLNSSLFVNKTVVLSFIFCSLTKKLYRQESHFGELITREQKREQLRSEFGHLYKDVYDEEKDKFKDSVEEDSFHEYYRKQDLSSELEKYCKNLEDGSAYFYKKAFHWKTELPAYITLLGDFEYDPGEPWIIPCSCSINKQNLLSYIRAVRKQIIEYIQSGNIKIETENAYSYFSVELGKILKNIYNKNKAGLALRELDNEIQEYGEPFLCIFLKEAIDSIISENISDENLARCCHCGKIIIKKSSAKIYCSKDIEGIDCKKKAQNKRYHEKKSKKLKKGT